VLLGVRNLQEIGFSTLGQSTKIDKKYLPGGELGNEGEILRKPMVKAIAGLNDDEIE